MAGLGGTELRGSVESQQLLQEVLDHSSKNIDTSRRNIKLAGGMLSGEYCLREQLDVFGAAIADKASNLECAARFWA
jgi:hypothetical protein